MATDKRLDQVSQLTDFDYALLVKGDQVGKMTKQQVAEAIGNLLYGATTKETLASVVAAVIGTANFSKNGLMPSNQYLSKSEVFANEEITSLEQIKDGMTFYFGAGTSVMPSPNGSVLKFSGSNCETYFASNENASNLFQRTIREGNDSGWQRIDNFGYNTLAELASGVAEQMGNPIGTTPSTISNANDISKNGIYRLYSTSIEESNSVPETGWSFALIYLKANWITAQLAIGQSNLYYRAKLDETASWSSVAWKKVTIG